VDFDLTDDEEALRDGVRKLLQGRLPMPVVRDLASTAGVRRSLWRELADAGVFSLRLPEAEGGAGLGMTQAVLVFEELGRALVPGPLVATHVLAGALPGAATGERVVGVLEGGEGPLVVEHLDALDDLVVFGGGATGGAGLAVIEDVRAGAQPLAPLDPLVPVHRLPEAPVTRPLAGAEAARRWRLEATALTAAMLLGVAQDLTDVGVAYAKERRQFDRAIGSFQAVKHVLADMLVRAEVARAAVYAAGATLDQPEVGDAHRAVAAAKAVAGDAATANGKACVQVHGGMGFTWEVDVHLYLKRAWVLDTHWGSVAEQSEAIAELL
jgi:alkylation response protein AidB-like acyl-CoA dehydrogenase